MSPVSSIVPALALLAMMAAPALAQTPALVQAPVPPEPAATAATAPPTGRLTLTPAQVAVVGSATFRVGRDLYQVAGIRSPRATRGACLYERLRGREARKQLVRLMRTGPIVVAPTGTVTRRGARLAEVTARGRNVGATLIARDVALPATAASRNPWCLGSRSAG
jgi:endonuclease YncB( thermonuclease family)